MSDTPAAPASASSSGTAPSADPTSGGSAEATPVAPEPEAVVAAERNHVEYERRVSEAQRDYDRSLQRARTEYRKAIDEASSAGSRRERDRQRRKAKAEYQDAKREHRADYERECGDAEELLLQAQVITFPDFGPIELDFTDGLLAATASSGLDVSYTVDTPTICMVTGTTVIGLDLGACTITASQSGDAITWAPASDVTVSVDVTAGLPQLPT